MNHLREVTTKFGIKSPWFKYAVIMTMLVIIASLLIPSCSTSSTTVSSDSQKPLYVMHLGFGAAPTTSDGMAYIMFSDLVKARSEGRVQIICHPMGELGPIKEEVDATKQGTQEMVSAISSYLIHLEPRLEATALPRLYADPQEMWIKYTNIVIPWADELLQQQGLKVLCAVIPGYSLVVHNSKHPIKTFDDFAGLKLRTPPSPMQEQQVKALGAVPAFIDFAEAYSAMEAGVVDGSIFPLAAISALKYNEVTKYLCTTPVAMQSFAGILMNKELFDELPSDIQEILLQSAYQVQLYQWQAAWQEEQVAVDNLIKSGMQVDELSAEDEVRLNEAFQPLYKWAEEKYGADTVRLLTGK